MENGIHRQDFFNLLKEAVKDGLIRVEQAIKEKKFIGGHYSFPKIGYFQSGFPQFSEHDANKCPLDYSDIFGYSTSSVSRIKKDVEAESIESWKKFKEFAEGDSFLKIFYGFGEHYTSRFDDLASKEWHSVYYTYGLIMRLVDRYVHIAGGTEFDEQKFAGIYSEWETSVFLPKLPLSVYVPIICTHFDFEDGSLDFNAEVVKMSDGIQLGRNEQHDITNAPHKIVIGAATHALVLHGWTMPNLTRDKRDEILFDFRAFASVLPQVDNFFAALRVVTGVETGYSQLVLKPYGWSDRWKAFLPSVYVVSTRAYPEHFEKFGWLRNPPAINLQTLADVSKVFKALKEATNNSLAIAMRRLNASFLRKDEEDSILDVTIALEILFGDSSPTEMTHKLAMRMAALSIIERCSDGEPQQIFDFVKKIYAYRSAIVHGSKKIESKRTIASNDKEDIPLVALGVRLLRYSIFALTKHPEFLDPKQLDRFLITRQNSFHIPGNA
jgi:hypothetical protein